MSKAELEKSLNSLEGWKKINKPFLFIFGGAKKSFPIYELCEEKGVFDNHILHSEEYDDNIYYIYAFSTKGQINEAKLNELKGRVANVDLGTLRCESMGFSDFGLFKGPEGSFSYENHSIGELSEIGNGIFIYPTAEIGDTSVDFPLVVYGKIEDKDYIYPIPNKFLK